MVIAGDDEFGGGGERAGEHVIVIEGNGVRSSIVAFAENHLAAQSPAKG